MPMDSLNAGEIGSLVALGIDGLIAFFSFKALRNYSKVISDVKDAEKVRMAGLDQYLQEQPNNELPYVAVEGVVGATNDFIKSRHGDAVGVIQNITITEHKAIRGQTLGWSDTKKTIKDVTERVPFYLFEKVYENVKVHVEDSEHAKMLDDSLISTYDQFTPTKSGVGEKVLDIISGELSKGIHEAEKMLLKGSQILGLGRLSLEHGKIKLSPPSDGKTYILTNLSKNGVINAYEFKTKVSKFFLWFSALVGGGILVYWIHKFYQRWRQQQHMRELRQAFEQQQQELAQRAEQVRQGGTSDGQENNTCIVCLNDRRTVVSVPCGHYCLCLRCAESLPQPPKCPYCRRTVERFVPVFNP